MAAGVQRARSVVARHISNVVMIVSIRTGREIFLLLLGFGQNYLLLGSAPVMRTSNIELEAAS